MSKPSDRDNPATGPGQPDARHSVEGIRTRTDVFISYAREDGDFARALRATLLEAGLTVWMDDSSIPAGAPFLSIIYDGIEGASNVLAVLSPSFANSRFCRLEIEYAVALNKRLVPLERGTVEADQVHPRVAQINWVPFPPDRPYDDAVRDCIAAVRLDLEWARAGVRFLQRALDWSNRRGNLLDRSGVAELQTWMKQSSARKSPPSDVVRAYLRASEQSLRRRQAAMFGAGIVFAAMLGLPLYAIVSSPAAAWKSIAASRFQPEAVAVTRIGEQERLWLHKRIGEVHHRHPNDPGDDVFEDKFALVEHDMDGNQRDEVAYYVDKATNRSRVGDFEFADEPNTTSELEDLLDQRLAATKEDQPLARVISAWERAVTPTTAAVRIESYTDDILLDPEQDHEADAWLRPLIALALEAAPPDRIGARQFPRTLAQVEVFRLPSGGWLAACQLMSGRYDVGMFMAQSTDGGRTWTRGRVIERRSDGAGFFLHAAGISAIVEGADARIFMTTRMNLSDVLGHPSGAPGQVAVSDDGGLNWNSAAFGHPIEDYESFSGIAIDARDPRHMALSIDGLAGVAASASAAIWLSKDGGQNWTLASSGLDIDPSARLQVLWLGKGPRLVATIAQETSLRAIVFRPLSLLERLRGQVGVDADPAGQ